MQIVLKEEEVETLEGANNKRHLGIINQDLEEKAKDNFHNQEA